MTFKVSDVVRLKSGGLHMTVEAVGDLIHCSWFEGTELKREGFGPATLEAAPPGTVGTISTVRD